MRDWTANTQDDLSVPDEFYNGGEIMPDWWGYTSPYGDRNITLAPEWFGMILHCKKGKGDKKTLKDLLTIEIHESIHRTRPASDSFWPPSRIWVHNDIYKEAAKRADEVWDSCYCFEDKNGEAFIRPKSDFEY